MLIPRRLTTHELLDDYDAPEKDMRRSLLDLRRLNTYAGGTRAFLKLIRIAAEGNKAFSVLDLGTGTSDLIESVRRRHPGAQVTGLDRNVRHLVHGREEGDEATPRVAADAFQLPFANASFDLVTSSHFFHHFSEDENVNMLTDSMRVARSCVIVTDTCRNFVPLAFVYLLGVFRLVGRITRHDAPASVRQGYTIREVRAIASRVSCRRFEVRRLIPYRFGLFMWK